MHDNAVRIAHELMQECRDVSIVYSDPDPELTLDVRCRLIRRPNELFWEDKFKAALDACGKGPMLVIHADCHCQDWVALASRCSKAHDVMADLGVWAPNIQGTPYGLSVSALMKLKNTDWYISALTDGIVFSLSPGIIERMRRVTYGSNPLGWGIDLLFCSAAHVGNGVVVIDDSVKVYHPRQTGYDTQMARQSMDVFMKNFTLRERVQCELLRSYVNGNHMRQRLRQRAAIQQ